MGLPVRLRLGARTSTERRYLDLGRRERSEVAVLMIDVDHFKQINDQHGHAHGDEVLRDFAHRLSHAIRRDDTCARLGGEEFCVVLGELDERNAEAIGERIRQRFQRKTGLLRVANKTQRSGPG